ncbi:MAG: ABC transporter permease, partial [Chloroflexota bacterium]
MRLTENLRIALNSLRTNKLRAALTMLGIMIGVAAVITLLSIGDGVTRFVAEQFSGLGTNLVFIVPTQEEQGRPGSDPLSESSLTIRDADLLADSARVPGITAVSPVLLRDVELQFEGNSDNVTIRAGNTSYVDIINYEVVRGRMFDEPEYNGRSRVAVIGADTVDELFPENIDPLGADIKVDGLSFRIIGVLGARGAGGFGGASQDDILVIPLTTAQERLFNNRSQRDGSLLADAILIEAASEEEVDAVIIDASDVLRQSHEINFRDQDDFQILTQQDFISALGSVTGVLTLFLGAIAS